MLVLSTGGSVLSASQPLSGVVRLKAAPARTTCCCGTPDGRCCGKACCLDQSKTSLPARQPLRTGGEESSAQVLALLGSTCHSFAPGEGVSRGGATVDQSALAAASSLQSRHVRIQT